MVANRGISKNNNTVKLPKTALTSDDLNKFNITRYDLNRYQLKPIPFKKKDLVGSVCGALLVIGESSRRLKNREKYWVTLCHCKIKNEYQGSALKLGRITSCGCFANYKKKKRGQLYWNDPNTIRKYRNRKGKHPLPFPEWGTLLIEEFAKGGLTQQELSDKYNIYPDTIGGIISKFRSQLNQQYEVSYLASIKKYHNEIAQSKIEAVLSTTFTRDELDKVCSDPEAEKLTEQEMLFALLWTRTGAADIALKDSGFLDTLKVKDVPRKKLLGIYLREKPNVSKFIKELQLKQLKDMAVSKETVQTELVSQIEQLKEACAVEGSSPTHRSNLIRSIELLGKSIDAFQSTIKIEEVNPAKALDHLIEMAKVESEYSIEDLEE